MSDTISSDNHVLTTVFCLLSGEHPTLPQAEAEAILESERYPIVAPSKLSRVLQFRSTINGAEAIARRAAYTRVCCEEVFSCESDETKIFEKIRDAQFDKFLIQGETFRVELIKVEPKIPFKAKMEEVIGRAILHSVPHAKVNLFQSDKTFLGIITEETFFFGIVMGRAYCRLPSVRPHLRPFFHPSAMRPKLARCMVNLSRAKPGSVFLDAFCGTGSNLIEAALMGCVALGSDIDPRMVCGAFLNLRFTGVREYCLCIADATTIPFISVDSCASDPPYGRSSSTHGIDAKELVEGFLGNIFDVLVSGSHVCLAFPVDQSIGELGRKMGYDVLESHKVKEHKSLTREVITFRRP